VHLFIQKLVQTRYDVMIRSVGIGILQCSVDEVQVPRSLDPEISVCVHVEGLLIKEAGKHCQV
jgi:transcriptional accessory protein Tex/SPT6